MRGKEKYMQGFQAVEAANPLLEDLISVKNKIWKYTLQVEWKGENWNYLPENRAVINTTADCRITKNVGNFSTS
jgi:hypothetical protein